MFVDFKNSQTKDNLMRAFAGESQARNRYTFAAGQAKQQKLQVLAEIFTYTANQEKEHAEIFYNFLKDLSGETITVDGTYPVDIDPSIQKILRCAEHNELEEHDVVYKSFAEIAKEEDGYVELPKFYTFPSKEVRERILYKNFLRVGIEVKTMIAEIQRKANAK